MSTTKIEKEMINMIFEAFNSEVVKNKEIEDNNTNVIVHQECLNNVVSEEKLRKVQSKTLIQLSNFLSKTYGPFGSMTEIVSGQDKDSTLADYSKDGLKVLKHVMFNQPIELSIQSEVEDICRYVESKVGDGTTSAVIISSKVFDGLNQIQQAYHLPPRRLIQMFNHCINNIKNIISSKGKDITLEDIYNICMISTNGNKNVSKEIENLYKQFGFDVSIDVSISNDAESKIKVYDGLTINQGYSDPAYINNIEKGTADIPNPRIYQFRDPIDTPEMVSYLEAILMNNIINPIKDDEDCINTVIVTPKITRDASQLLKKLVELLHGYDSNEMQSQKPKILIVTNLSGSGEDACEDICTLCHCKSIIKYIDPKIQKADQDNGSAPTLENITEWYGTAELVSSDTDKTKFINPIAMTNENDNTYESIINFLESELKNAKENNDDANKIGRINRRIRSLKSNMIEYLVGGISISDRNQLKDLIEDAVKNCASSAEFGVGRAANFEGLCASYKLAYMCVTNNDNSTKTQKITNDIYYAIFKAYYEAACILYSTVLVDEEDVRSCIEDSLRLDKPFNVMDLFDAETEEELDVVKSKENNVLCSIRTDIEIIDAISKIITTMVTSNQCLLQATVLNNY